ncbi:hypothetical protein LMG29660_02854 [Burkholderia puraquae]|nr:hypothetical protein LMG29660_02854 [Burkholderia puraquae]
MLNANQALDNQCRVLRVQPVFPPHAGKLQVLRTETPNEAKVRLMNQLQPDSSYHSGVMSGRRNHRCATAFDVSVGQGRVLDDPILAKLLRSIADWRIPFASLTKGAALERYNQLDHTTREIVEATCRYYGDGTFPSDRLVPKKPPQQVVSEVYKQQQDFKKQEEQRLEKERIDQRNQQLKAQADKVKSTIQQDMDQLQQRLGQGADAARQGVNQAVEQGKQAVKNLIDKF